MSKKINKIKKVESDGKLKSANVSKKSKVKKERVGFFKRVINFLKELKGELKKVVWPTKKNVVVSTFVVILAIAMMAVFVMFADYIFRSFLKTLLRTL